MKKGLNSEKKKGLDSKKKRLDSKKKRIDSKKRKTAKNLDVVTTDANYG